MKIKNLLSILFIFTLAACDSGDVNINPETSTSNSNNTTTTATPVTTEYCASYNNSGGDSVKGSYNATTNHCTYSSAFSSASNNITVDLLFKDLPGNGAHIFEASLFMGNTYKTDAAMTAAGITKGGDGPKLTVEAGATLAWTDKSNFLVINRGSQIFADGSATKPITFTSKTDVDGTVGAEDVQQWGGIVINGFGVTNKCSYTNTRGESNFALASECHIDSEGSAGVDENQYGGINDADNSGSLQYVVVKHTGATVGNGDELNGITFGAVGSNTTVKNLQVYSVYDDGIEMFGGAVNVENYVGLYVRDDSIDLDEGWHGTIKNALVIHSATDGNHCIESDGIGSYSGKTTTVREDFVTRKLNTRATISNLTCIISPNGAATATHDPGAGWRIREGIWMNINDSMLISSFGANDTASTSDNYLLRIESAETHASFVGGDSNLNSVIYSVQENEKGTTITGSNPSVTEKGFAESEGNVFATVASGSTKSATATNDTDLQLLEGTQPFYSILWATSQVNGAAPANSSKPTGTGTYLGALSTGVADWTFGWTYGLHPSNRGQALWFESL